MQTRLKNESGKASQRGWRSNRCSKLALTLSLPAFCLIGPGRACDDVRTQSTKGTATYRRQGYKYQHPLSPLTAIDRDTCKHEKHETSLLAFLLATRVN